MEEWGSVDTPHVELSGDWFQKEPDLEGRYWAVFPGLPLPGSFLDKSIHCFLCKFHHPLLSSSIIVIKINVSRVAEALFTLVISNLLMSQMSNESTASNLCQKPPRTCRRTRVPLPLTSLVFYQPLCYWHSWGLVIDGYRCYVKQNASHLADLTSENDPQAS